MKFVGKITIAVFCFIIFGLFITNIILPDNEFSQTENRYLQQAPVFSFKTLLSGDFTKDFEKYVTDQFSFKDIWIGLKTACEITLGKSENNDVFICKDGNLIERFEKPNYERIDKNITSINTFTEKLDIPVHFMLVPNAVKIYEHKLPRFAQNYDQLKVINYTEEKLTDKAQFVQIYDDLEKHNNEYIFYKNDHHWTSLGAYYGYCSLADNMKINNLSINDFNVETVTNQFLGTMYSKSGVSWSKPDKIDVYKPKNNFQCETKIIDKNTIFEGLYDWSYLDVKDKYSLFIGGNNSLVKINTNIENDKRLLIIKDSYAHALIPFISNHFSEVHIIDLRYYNDDIVKYVDDNNIDNVVILYNVSNFCSDNNLIWLSAY